MKNKFAAQLYTLRDELQKDFHGTLKTLKDMGWSGVQIDGLHGYEPEEIAYTLEKTGLKVAGMHIGLDRMQNELEQVKKEAELFGTKDIFCHYLEKEYQHVEGYKYVKEALLNVARILSPEGYRVGYHHHEFEFETEINGMYALEYLLEAENGLSLYPEIDTYWVQYAGIPPLEFMANYSHRIPILHLKDMTTDDRKTFAEVGTGLIDFKPILQWGENNGVEWYAVEQDFCDGSPLESLEISLLNLNRLAESLS